MPVIIPPAGGGGGDFLPLAGGVMRGDIDMDGRLLVGANRVGTNNLVLDNEFNGEHGVVMYTQIDEEHGDSVQFYDRYGDESYIRVSGVATPYYQEDAANKQYVDSVAGGGGGAFLPLAGGTMLGTLNMGYQGIDGVATIRFQDVQMSEGQGTLELLSNGQDPVQIKNVAAPSVATDAATRGWVEAAIAAAIASAIGGAY